MDNNQEVKNNQATQKKGFKQVFVDFFKGYVDFKGQTSRREYWFTILMLVIFYVILLGIFTAVILANSNSVNIYGPAAFTGLIVVLLVSLGLILPTIALNVRRSRDAGLRGRGYLVLYIINFAASYANMPGFYGYNRSMGYMMNSGYYNLLGANSFLSFIGIAISLFFFVVTLLPTDEMTTKSDNAFVKFFFRSKN